MVSGATTRWSLILAARADDDAGKTALAQLCQNYRPVILAYFRRKEQPHLAEDRTQAFFMHFLEQELHQRADATRGSFRAFLFTSARHHWQEALRRESAQKRSGGTELGEDAFSELTNSALSPEAEFDRDWAFHVVHRARAKLRQEAECSGKSALFAAVEEFLLEPPDSRAYVVVGASLAMPPNTVAVAVRRLRERLRALVRRELADTLPLGADIDSELRWLKQALSNS